jgi:tetratricopeptide (TPR) repeat protein
MDLYLQTLMNGEIMKKAMVSVKEDSIFEPLKQAVDEEIEKRLEGFIPNPLQSLEQKRAALREELKNEMELHELSSYLKRACQTFGSTGHSYIEHERFVQIEEEFKEAYQIIADPDFSIESLDLRESLDISDQTLQALYDFAVAQFDEGLVLESLSLLILISQFIFDNPDIWYRLGIIAHQLENYDLAIRAYQGAIALNSALVGARLWLIECLLIENRTQEAQEKLKDMKNYFDAKAIESSWQKIWMLLDQKLAA